MATAASDEVRLIEAEAIPTRFARGWHCLGLTESFQDGKPHSVNAFGQKLVIFQGEDGSLNVLDAHCRHLGGDLSQGTIKGNEIACPFHDWRWGGDGRCKKIPYSKRVPLRARTASWTTMDKNGMLFIWNDPEGNPPTPEITIPDIEGYGADNWTDWIWSEQIVNVNCREIVDNVVDMAHFFYVHYSFPTYFKNVFEGHTATQIMRGRGRVDTQRPKSEGGLRMVGNDSEATYYGPAFMIDKLVYDYDDFKMNSVLINAHYPIDQNSFMLMSGIMTERTDALPGKAADELAKKSAGFILMGFEQDIAVWRTKARIDNPLLCEEDGPVYQVRRWYEQFYTDIADVKPEMTQRFEFELDTTAPVAAWEAEVERNLAARDAAAKAQRK